MLRLPPPDLARAVTRDRTSDDLPWAAHPVTLIYGQRRIRCRRMRHSHRARRVRRPKGPHYAPVAADDRRGLPVDADIHAAVRHGVSWGKARRAEKAFLAEWDRAGSTRQPRYIGLDEIHRGKAQKFCTVLSDVVHGEVIGVRGSRGGQCPALVTACLDARQRAAVQAVCTDMHQAYLNAVARELPHSDIVFDKFPCAPARLDGARRGPSPGVLSGWRGDARLWPREAVAVAATLEDRPRIEAPTAPDLCSPRIVACSRRTCCGSNSIGCGPTRLAPAC